MDRVAVMVDAGYFFAAGSALVSGRGKQRRNGVIIDERAAIDALRDLANTLTGGVPLLRIYWYDGASRKTGPTAEHVRLAGCNDVKVRLGFLNASGQQKGVDSLIVTDLVELARNRSVSDVVLMSGDEDVRIGVQLAQSFGVRVHLVGIKPHAGTQSVQLLQEADTCTEWGVPIVAKMLSLRAPSGPQLEVRSTPGVVREVIRAPLKQKPDATVKHKDIPDAPALDAVLEQLLAELTPAELNGAAKYLAENSNNVPHEIDGKLLATCRTALGRNLDGPSRRYVRGRARQRLREEADKNSGQDHCTPASLLRAVRSQNAAE
jgi:uncharacterized LabA/DUF88 family protein